MFNSCNPITPQIAYRKKHIDFLSYIEMKDRPQIDILTIGDSFSNGVGGCYYQDYIAGHFNKTVVNVGNTRYDAITCLKLLEKNGYLQEIKPKVVILESVERYMDQRFAKNEIKIPMGTREFFLATLKGKNNGLQADAETKWAPKVMLKANGRYIYNKFKYRNTDNRLSDEVFIEKLCNPLFTNLKQETTLLFLSDDLWYIKKKADCAKINKQFNELADKLAWEGIQLVCMPCVDKFDLYYPYLKNREHYEANTFFEEFDQLPKRYICVNTKQILQEMLAENEKDVYWLDDAHWSWKGLQRVSDYIMQKIDN